MRLVTYRVSHRTHRQAWSRGPWHAPERTRSMATCRMTSRTIPAQMISSVCRRAKTQMVLREANKCDTSTTKTPADASISSELIEIIIRQVTGGHHGTVRKPPRCQNSQASNFHTLTFPLAVFRVVHVSLLPKMITLCTTSYLTESRTF